MEESKKQIEDDARREWEREKQQYEGNERSETYQQISKDIQVMKHKVRE